MEDKSQYKYSVVKDSPDPTAIRIKKEGLSKEFTLAEVKRDRAESETCARQWKAQRDLEIQKMENVELHHPFVKDLTPEQLFVVHFYQTCKGMVDLLEPKIKEVEENIIDLDAEVEEIEKQVGVAFPLSVLETTSEEEAADKQEDHEQNG